MKWCGQARSRLKYLGKVVPDFEPKKLPKRKFHLGHGCFQSIFDGKSRTNIYTLLVNIMAGFIMAVENIDRVKYGAFSKTRHILAPRP